MSLSSHTVSFVLLSFSFLVAILKIPATFSRRTGSVLINDLAYFGCAGSPLLPVFFSSCVSGATLRCGVQLFNAVASLVVKPGLVGSWASACGLSSGGSWALEHRLSSCGTWA